MPRTVASSMAFRCSTGSRVLVLLALGILALVAGPAAAQPVAAAPPPPLDASSAAASSDNKLLCMAEMVSKIEESCSNPAKAGYYVVLEDTLKDYLAKCFHTNFSAGRALHIMLPSLTNNVNEYLKQQANAFGNSTLNAERVEVVPTFVPAPQINSEIEFELEHNLTNSHDGWVLDPMGLGSIYNFNGFFNLSTVVDPANKSSIVDWQDIHPYFRNTSMYYDGLSKSLAVVTLPLDGNIKMLYYRADVFARLNYTVPKSWDDVVKVATAFKNARVDINGDNSPDYGFCFERRKDCEQGPFDLLSILAPYVQYNTSSQGLIFDPSIVRDPERNPAMVDTAAMYRALTLYKQLVDLSPNTSKVDDKCPVDVPNPTVAAPDANLWMAKLFGSGSCLMGVGLGDYFKEFHNQNVSRGSLGVALMPGSYEILNRTTNDLVRCTPQLCPFAEAVTTETGETRYLNRAPFAAGGGWVAAVNQRSPAEYRNASVLFYLQLSQPDRSWEMVLNSATPFDPYRLQHFSNLSRWVGAGYNANDTRRYLEHALASFNHGNIAVDLRVPGTKLIREVLNSATANMTLNTNISDVIAMMNSSFAKLLTDSQQKTFRAQLAEAYIVSINYNNIDYLNGSNDQDKQRGGSPSWLPIAIVLPTVAALLLIAVGMVYEVRNNRKHKNLIGKVVPPGLGADTTILISEIQDFTAMVDQLPSEVLDRMLKEYHECLRRLLLRHSGYEGSCEGDSLIVAFHSPKDALVFAMDAQAALLNIDWPQELLALPSCAQQYVQGILNTGRSKALADILDAGDDPLPPGASKVKALTPGLGHDLHHASGATLPSLANVASNETFTFGNACQRAWKEAARDDNNKVLIFRGPRVRMGLHAGLHNASDVTVNKADGGRTSYSGDSITMARAVTQAAQGGTVLLSEETYKKLPLERLWDKYLVLHVGEHHLRDSLPNLNLYHALNRTLEGRLAYVGPTVSISQLDPGVLDAPVGCVTVAFMNVVGAQTLLSWNADVAQQAMKIFHVVVGEELKRRKGYLVEAVDGLFLAAFQRPGDAILWALECNENMIKQEWPEDLLSHELCEELVISAPTKEGEIVNTVVFRGLRLKTGVDTGQVLGEVHAMTGRMTYRGKVMNRAARIASTASTGQVLCSSDSWQLAATNDTQVLHANKVTGTTLGQFRLKGVAEKIEIHHCRKVSSVAPARRASSLVMSMNDHWNWEHNLAMHHQVNPAVVSPEDILLGPADSIRAEMLSPKSFTRNQSDSFRQTDGPAAELGIELAPEHLVD